MPFRINKYSRSFITWQMWQSGSDGITTVAHLLNWSVLEDGTHTTTLSENIFMSWSLIKCSAFPRVSYVISPIRKWQWKVVVSAAQNNLASCTEWQTARIIFKLLGFCWCYIDQCLSLCPFSFRCCITCPSMCLLLIIIHNKCFHSFNYTCVLI